MNFSRKSMAFPFILDHKPGYFLSWLLYRLFKRVQFDPHITEDLKQMHRNGVVVYANKYRGHLDYLLYHYRYRRSRLPYPTIAFNLNMILLLPISRCMKVFGFYFSHIIKYGRMPSPFKSGFYKQSILRGTTSLLSLVDPKGFSRYFIHSEKDPLAFLIEVQKEMERPIFIIPQLIIYKKTPEKEYANLFDIFFGFHEKPGLVRKIVLFFRHSRRAFIDFGRPMNLKAYIEDRVNRFSDEQMAREIKQMLTESIDTQKRVILGPVMKSRQQLKERVLTEDEIIDSITEMASGNVKKLKRLKKKADDYFNEIAAKYNTAYIDFFNIVLTWFWKRLFEGIDVSLRELTEVREWARKGTVIYVPSHKSHIDYLVLNYILYKHHMHVPRIAAGKNLSFWPMGHIFRNSGAFFIRRSFRGATLYSKVFVRYIKALLAEGYPLEFFIEGGRSRSGKLTLPKLGFLSILIHAHREGYCKDLIFIPASIIYDRIVEQKSYLYEVGGNEKKQESLAQFVKARHLLKRKYGKIYIRFGQPISLNQYIAQVNNAEKKLNYNLAYHLIRSINRATLVTPYALLASAILTRHRRGFTLPELTSTAAIFITFLKKRQISFSKSLTPIEKTVEETLSLMMNRKVVNYIEETDAAETFYFVDDEKKLELEYYKNSIIHFFIPYAFVAVTLLTHTAEITPDEDIHSDFQFLMNVFRNEFAYDDEWEAEQTVDHVLKYFFEESLLIRPEDKSGYQLKKAGFDKLPIWAALAKTYLESYWIAASAYIEQRPDKERKSSELLKKMSTLGQRFHRMGLIDHIESISQVSFNNAIRLIKDDIVQPQGRDQRNNPEQVNQDLSAFCQRLYEFSHYRV